MTYMFTSWYWPRFVWICRYGYRVKRCIAVLPAIFWKIQEGKQSQYTSGLQSQEWSLRYLELVGFFRDRWQLSQLWSLCRLTRKSCDLYNFSQSKATRSGSQPAAHHAQGVPCQKHCRLHRSTRLKSAKSASVFLETRATSLASGMSAFKSRASSSRFTASRSTTFRRNSSRHLSCRWSVTSSCWWGLYL